MENLIIFTISPNTQLNCNLLKMLHEVRPIKHELFNWAFTTYIRQYYNNLSHDYRAKFIELDDNDYLYKNDYKFETICKSIKSFKFENWEYKFLGKHFNKPEFNSFNKIKNNNIFIFSCCMLLNENVVLRKSEKFDNCESYDFIDCIIKEAIRSLDNDTTLDEIENIYLVLHKGDIPVGAEFTKHKLSAILTEQFFNTPLLENHISKLKVFPWSHTSEKIIHWINTEKFNIDSSEKDIISFLNNIN